MIPINPTESAFVEFAQAQGPSSAVPLVVRLANDRATPSAVFDAMQQKSRFAFLLESVETGERIGRYSFLGADPQQTISFSEGVFSVLDSSGNKVSESEAPDPLVALADHMKLHQCMPSETGLPPFLSGAIGYLGYDCAHFFEPVGDMKEDRIGLPEMQWMVADVLIAFDHFMSDIYLVKTCLIGDESVDYAALYRSARASIELATKYINGASAPDIDVDHCFNPSAVEGSLPESNFTKEEYGSLVGRAKGHICKGDIFQVVPSQRFVLDADFPPFEAYRHLRRINPSPYMFYLKFDDMVACGSSPEMMVRCQGGKLSLCPIAGTRKRGTDSVEDNRLAEELINDPKERAEHLMLVDLGRNDLGRVAVPGSVRIEPGNLMKVERYSHVMHIVSEVNADLAPGFNVYDAVRATFPAGTLSGAPKVRAMQIINDFEPMRRNLYGGLCGYFGFDGNSDTCIAIRMFVKSGGKIHIQAGGGLVADSDPDLEYQESVNKAKAVIRAAEMARHFS